MPLIDDTQAAFLLGVSSKTVGRYCDAGKLKRVSLPPATTKKGSKPRSINRVDRDEVMALVKSSSPQAPAKRPTRAKPTTAGRALRRAL